MKKTTLAVAALLTALSSVSVLSVAYAEDTTTAPTTTNAQTSSCKGTCAGCKGSDTCKGSSCKGSTCGGCKGSTGTKQ